MTPGGCDIYTAELVWEVLLYPALSYGVWCTSKHVAAPLAVGFSVFDIKCKMRYVDGPIWGNAACDNLSAASPCFAIGIWCACVHATA